MICALLRLVAGRTAPIFDGRTLQSSPESGGRAGYDGYKKKHGSKTRVAVDTLGHLLALHINPGQRAGTRLGRGPRAGRARGHP